MTYNKNSHQQVQTIARTSPAIANPLGARKMPIIEKINPNNRKQCRQMVAKITILTIKKV